MTWPPAQHAERDSLVALRGGREPSNLLPILGKAAHKAREGRKRHHPWERNARRPASLPGCSQRRRTQTHRGREPPRPGTHSYFSGHAGRHRNPRPHRRSLPLVTTEVSSPQQSRPPERSPPRLGPILGRPSRGFARASTAPSPATTASHPSKTKSRAGQAPGADRHSARAACTRIAGMPGVDACKFVGRGTPSPRLPRP